MNIVDISYFEVLQLIVYAYTCSAYIIIISWSVLDVVWKQFWQIFSVIGTL